MDEGSSSSERLLRDPEAGERPSSRYSAETKLFGPSYAYYKEHKHGVSWRLWFAAFFTVIICLVDFLLVTNIIIYVRTMNPDSREDVLVHTALILLHVALIWATYRLMVWYVEAYGITESVKKNKLYQRVATDIIELENMIRPVEAHARAD